MKPYQANPLTACSRRGRDFGPRTGKSFYLCCFLFLVAYGEVVNAAFIQEQKLTASGGQSVAFVGNRVVVGAPLDDGTGAVYVYRFDLETMEWLGEQKLTASDGLAGDQFGFSVAAAGDRIVVGAPIDDGQKGSAYVFRYDAVMMKWLEEQKLTAPDGEANDFFGYSVAGVQDWLVVGSPLDDDNGSRSGSLYIFRSNPGTNTWLQAQKLVASDGATEDTLGISVAMSEDRIVAGAYLDDHNGIRSGSAYVYRLDISVMKWSQEQKLIASTRHDSDLFGVSVGIAGNRVVAGTWRGNASYVFRFDIGTLGWVEEQRLYASDGTTFGAFGYDIAIAGNRVVVGAFAEGSAYVFRFDSAAGAWTQEQKLLPLDPVSGDSFGASVAVAGDRILVGAPGTRSAYIFNPSSDKQGPITSAVIASPNPAPVLTDITLTAIADDTETGSPAILRADYQFNGGVPIPMDAQDGVFDEITEPVRTTILGFKQAGVHQVCVDATDIVGNIGAEECVFIAIFDPNGAFVTGGGWINSPVGAYTAQPSLTGLANFGFVSKYEKGANIPTGVTDFRFKVADLNFHSGNYQWLVIAGSRAQFRGLGTINGSGIYGFLLTAIDGQISGGGGVDKFRIKIWEDATGMIMYDNKLGSEDLGNDGTELSDGNIFIHAS